MGHITRRNGRWQAAYRDPDKRERTRTFDRKQDAERWLATVQTDMLRGAWVDPAAGQETFGSYAERWAAAQMWRPSTARGRKGSLELHILPTFGPMPLSAIRLSDLQAWARGRSEVLAPNTLQNTVGLVRAIFKAAVADQVIARSPADRLVLPKVPKNQMEILERGQVLALADAMRPRFRGAVLVAACAGLRQGEVFGLAGDRVGFLRREIRVDQQLVMGAEGEPFLGPPKTAASSRVVPVPDELLSELTEHMRSYGVARDGLLFTNETARTMTAPMASHLFREGAAKAGLPKWASWHDLRHFYASVLIDAGESVKVVQTRLGHSSAAITLDVYSHLWPDSEDRTRRAVASVLGAVADRSESSAAD